jgi:prophage DNA circulation protein
MGLWEELLQPGSLDDVGLPVGRRRITGGRVVARKELPYVGGQEVEPMGRMARKLEVTVELFADVDEALYPERYEQLVALLEDDEEPVHTWTDPVWGAMQVIVTSWDVDENAEARDGASISMTLEEVGFAEQADAVVSLLTTSDRSRAETDAAELDGSIAEAGITDADLEGAWNAAGFARADGESLSFADQVTSLIADVDDAVQDAEAVAAIVDRTRARIQGVVGLAQARTTAAWPVLERGARLIDTVARIGDEAIAQQGRIVLHTTTGPTSVYELANKLYGDMDRVDEILRRNSLPNPLFIRPGSVLRVLER